MKPRSLLFSLIFLFSAFVLSACGSITGGSPPNVYLGAVFISDRDTAGVDELYYADTASGVVTKLSADTLVGDVKSFKINPNIGFIAYLSDHESPGTDELFYIKQSVGIPAKVNSDLTVGQNITAYEWSPNGLYLAYIIDLGTPGGQELYITDAKTTTKVSTGLTGGVIDFKWAPNLAAENQTIVFRAKANIGSITELYTSTFDGTVTAVALSTTSQSTGVTKYEWSEDSLRVAYLSDQNSADVMELFVAEVSNQSNIEVSDISTGDVIDFQWPNLTTTTSIAYTANPTATDPINLYVTSNGSNTNVVSVSGVTSPGNVSGKFDWTPSDGLLVYVADQDTDEVYELYSVTPSGSTLTKLSGVMTSGGDVDQTDGFILGLFGSYVVYRADQVIDNVYELYSSTLNSDTSTHGVKISADLAVNQNVSESFVLSPFGNLVAYIADQDTDEIFDVYITGLLNNSSVLNLSNNQTTANKVFQFDWSSDGTKVFYIADRDNDGFNDVFTTSVLDQTNTNITSAASAPGVSQAAFIDSLGLTETLLPL